MPGLSFIPLGVGDAFSARHYSSCLAVEAEGSWLLVDCPHPIRKMMREAGATAGEPLDVDRVAAVVLTHLHGDHASGVEGFGYFCRFVLGRRALLVAHPSVAARLWDGHLAAGMEQLIDAPGAPPRRLGFADYFDLLSVDEERPLEVGPFVVECRRTIHHVPTTALRIRGAGRCLGHSADTAFDPTLIDWLDEADLIVHETNYGVHTPYQSLLDLPDSVRRKLRLNHYPDQFEPWSSAIECLVEGRRYEV